MRARMHWIAALTLALVFTAAAAHAAKVVGMSGPVHVRIPDSEWYRCTNGLQIKSGMSFRTGKKGRLVIKFGDESSIVLTAVSEMTVSNPLEKKLKKGQAVHIVLHAGAIVVKDEEDSPDHELRLSTSAAAVTAARGAFTVAASENGPTVLAVVSGEACAEAKNKKVCPDNGYSTTVKKKSAPAPQKKADADTVNLWKQEKLLTKDSESAVKPGALKLETYKPADESYLSTPRITVSGSTAPGASVTVNGQSVDVREGGGFSTEIKLGEGKNPIKIKAKLNGKTAEHSMTVYLDTTPPLLTISQPVDHFDPSLMGRCDQRKCYIQIFGITEPGATLHINRQNMTHYVESDGNFYIMDFPVNHRESRLVVEATDRSDLTTMRIITIDEPSDMDGDGVPDMFDDCPLDPGCQ